MKIAPLFLRASREVGGLGLSLKEIGTLNGVFGSAAFVLGSLLAGIYVSKFGLKRTLFTLCCIFNLPFLAYTFLAVTQPTNVYLIGTCITMEYFGYGFGFDTVYDATDSSGETSNVALCICIRNYELGSNASGHG